MSEYKELVDRLKFYADTAEGMIYGVCVNAPETMKTAADAIEQLVKMARQLCEGFLDMPSGCDGCPLVDTQILDEEGNGICALYRRSSE